MARAQTTSKGAARDTAESVLARGARVRGRVSGEGSLRVEGQIDGDVTVTGDLAIHQGGGVKGDVDAHSVTIEGALEGDVAARGPVAIRSSAKVRGHMGGAEVSLEEGAQFNGRIEAEFDLPSELISHRARS